MKTFVSASGYINVVLVLNMKRFIHENDQSKFESIRGTQKFGKTLRQDWLRSCKQGGVFLSADEERQKISPEDEMSTEEIGFATGIFRSPYLEEHTYPTYIVNKERFPFDEHLRENYQFANLFWRAWKHWDIYIRPTSTGVFVIRLLYKFPKPLSTEAIASHVIELQESLDVRSAKNWLNKLPDIYPNQPDVLAQKEKSVRDFLTWLGAGEGQNGAIKYIPVQWKIAMEVANKFIREVNYEIPLDANDFVRLNTPTPSLSNPLHDSFVIYHIDELTASRCMVPRFTSNKSEEPKGHSSNTQVAVLIKDIQNSVEIQQHLANLIEGSVLLRREKSSTAPQGTAQKRIFPALEPEYIKNIFKNEQSSWSNELCLLSARSAIFYPARNLRNDELLISTLPSATSRVQYIRYWGALERMLEFTLEIRVLAQLVERASYKLLGSFATNMQDARNELLKGDIKLDSEKFIDLVSSATDLRRLAALCQGLGNPSFWSRAEYAITKANFIFEKMGMPQLLEQIDRNIDSVNSAVDHLDELYLADLAEDNNNISFVLTLGLAAFSLLLTMLIIPSFWADLIPSKETVPLFILKPIEYIGDLLAILSLAAALGIGTVVGKHAKRIRAILYKFLWK